jgi:signal peptidase I
MAHSRRSSRSEDDDSDEDEEDDEEPERPRPRRQPPRRSSTSHSGSRPAPVRRWRGPEDEEDEEPEPPRSRASARRASRERHPVYWRARDSLYFEPLVALAIIVVILVGLFAYTQNWPPVYVVESDSMQHGSNDVLGLINTGDLVLAQKIDPSAIVPYVVGLSTGYSTYGEYGDVILYQPNGGSSTPVIHRAIVYLTWNPGSASYDAPQLSGLPCGTAHGAVYATPGTSGECGTTDLTGNLELFHIGWMSANVTLDLSSPALGQHSGFVTMGDNNVVCPTANSCVGTPDQQGSAAPLVSELVEPGWVIGVARGMIPWFGSVKLLLEGNTADVPSQSWQFLGLTLAGVILLAFGIHYALRAEGIETPLRKEEEEEEREVEEESPDEGDGRARRWLRSLRPWHRGDEDDEDEEEPEAPRRPRRSSSVKETSEPHRRGRPRPKVRRSERPSKKPRDDDL